MGIFWLKLKVVSFFYTRDDLSKEENQNMARIKFYELDLILRNIDFSNQQKIRMKTKQLGVNFIIYSIAKLTWAETYTFVHIISQLS